MIDFAPSELSDRDLAQAVRTAGEKAYEAVQDAKELFAALASREGVQAQAFFGEASASMLSIAPPAQAALDELPVGPGFGFHLRASVAVVRKVKVSI